MWQEEALVLGRSGRGHAMLSIRASPLGQQDCRDCAQRQGVRPAFYSKRGHNVKMEA